MTKQTLSGPMASLFSSRGLGAAALGLVGGLALAVTGCDTVAQISFTQRGFNEIHASGFVPAGGGFEGSVDACESTSGDMTMRFVMTDTSRRPIRLGRDQINNQSVELDPRSDVTFDQSALFEIPQAETDVGGYTGARVDMSCTEAEGCEGPSFGCATAPSIPPEPKYDACFVGGDVSVSSGGDSVRYVSDLERHKLFGIAYEVSGSVVGSLPTVGDTPYAPTTTPVFWDQDGDGLGDIAVVPEEQNEDLASDPNKTRISSLSQAQTSYFLTRGLVTDEGRQMGFAGWHFSNGAPISPAGGDSPWATSPQNVQSSIQGLRSAMNPFTPFSGTHAEVYDAAESIITDFYTDEAIGEISGGDRMLQAGIDKILVLVVDGPDDERESLDGVIQAARDNNVRVFVVHYDTGFEPEITEQLYDVPQYLISQINDGQPCTDDSDCKNFETCRQFRGFSDTQGSAVKSQPDETYCFPQRNANGRIGPIQDYSMLGCATGGGYTYIRSPEALSRAVGWMPYAVEGLWEVDATSDQVEDLPGGQALLMQSLFGVTVAGTNKTYQFSQVGGRASGQADSTVAETDTRSPIFIGE